MQPAFLLRMASSVSKRVLCYGDSLTAGYCEWKSSFKPYSAALKLLLNENVPGSSFVDVDSFGFCGWTTGQLLSNATEPEVKDFTGNKGPGFKAALDNCRYDLVILMAGTNDLGKGFQPQEIFQNIKELSQMATAQNLSTILHLGIPDSAYLSANPGARQRQFEVNSLLFAYARQQQTEVFYAPVALKYSEGSQDFAEDGLHFSETGYKHLAEEIAPTVRHLLFKTG